MRIKKLCAGLTAIIMFSACSPDRMKTAEEAPSRIITECEVKTIIPENPKGKINVYDAMARAAKYNVGTVTEKMHEKIYGVNSSLSPKEIVTNLLSSSTGSDNKVYNGIRALDYAIVYASAAISSSPMDIHDDILEKSAQNLALAAIKSHNDMLFAEKADKEIIQMLRNNQKQLKELEEKSARGRLLPEEIEYKKALEVNIYKLTGFHDLMLMRQVEYKNLIKDKRKIPELDGRRFYELDSLDKKLTAEVFERSALRYRHEFRQMNGKEYTYGTISRYMNAAFDGSYRLDINGYKENNPLFIDTMEKQASVIANRLIDTVSAYQNNKQERNEFRLRERVYDNLSAAIFTQIELAYNMLQMVMLDLEKINGQIKELTKEVVPLKNKELTYARRAELMEKQTALTSLKMTRSQIIGERAVAIRALFFYAGYAPFNCPTLNMPPQSIAQILRRGFSEDAVRMLAQLPKEHQEEPHQTNEWAKHDGWIEELVDKKETQPSPASAPKQNTEPLTDYDLYGQDESYNRRQTIKIGSYKNTKSAELEWQMLREIYPQLKNYTPSIIRSGKKGQITIHTLVKSPDGGLRDLCNDLRRDKIQCVLK